MSTRRLVAVPVVGALALAVVLAGCGGATATSTTAATTAGASSSGPAPSAAAGSQHNAIDVEFAQMMIVHHRQAIDMAQLATDRAERAEVKALAGRIEAAQTPEITQLTGFLTAWGAPLPDAGGTSTGMDHGDMSGSAMPAMPAMPRMMTSAQMDQLRTASGAAFDTAFLQMMIDHHRGAVESARQELADGANPDAKLLAATIVQNQSAEIDEMQQLLG